MYILGLFYKILGRKPIYYFSKKQLITIKFISKIFEYLISQSKNRINVLKKIFYR